MDFREETRQLAEIQRQLTKEDPALARLLATGRPAASADFVIVLGAMLASFAGGLLSLLLGALVSSAVMLVSGVILVAVVPAVLATWRFRWYR
ncbi:DUF3040 domain-containing protein [Amycolatopsis rhizosphaerae]|uniref:DUF3040 domain-containing protein n=1 Tax=Amycolatopsis rhizosphaerae TaxID=2053003 RepID=A0A558D734_9PSEU|nr:DUF3040 domain-containing protein [Amycolatopsis rhizosphaerae]TVT56829.1 DUF3040 domain-containing protein [Amycolatopsis rhizosphaerae]